MTRHTPGPYEAWAIPGDRLKRFRIVCVNTQRCPGTGKDLLADKVRRPEDARLFAAAPDLLEALERAVAEAVAGPLDPWFAQALEAISKATEESES